MTTKSQTLKRLEDQIDWYDKKSQTNKEWWNSLKTIEIIIAGLIPFLSIFDNMPKFVLGLAGMTVAIIEGVVQHFKFHDNWFNYRATCEKLRHEKYLWEAGAGYYQESKDELILADRIESLISQEHAQWIAGQKMPLLQQQ